MMIEIELGLHIPDRWIEVRFVGFFPLRLRASLCGLPFDVGKASLRLMIMMRHPFCLYA